MPRAILAAALKSEIEKGIKKSGSAKNGAGLSGRLEMPTPNKVKIRNAKNADASAVTASAGDTHVVGIGNLRVAIESDGKSWTAQGLEIDYIAQGSDLEDAKKQFEDGLACTIHQHLRIYGNIDSYCRLRPGRSGRKSSTRRQSARGTLRSLYMRSSKRHSASKRLTI